MESKKVWILLLSIFLIALSFRFYYAFQTTTFNDDVSYYSLRQAQHISLYGYPIFQDHLSYGGRTIIFTPIFYYILAFFNLFLPIGIVGKVIPNIFASLSVFIIFFISRDLTHNSKIALFSSSVSVFIPVFFSDTVNSVTPYSLVIPLLLSLIYLFIRINKARKYQVYFISILLILLFTHPTAAIFVMGLIIFISIMKLENMKVAKAEMELTIFSAFFLLWFNFLIFKKAFILYGISIIWYNIPSIILANYFSEINILKMVNLIGVIPFFYGIYIVYKYIFKQKNRSIYLVLSFIFAVGILLWFKLIPFRVGLMFLGIFLILLLSVYLKLSLEYLKKTRFIKLENIFIFSLLFAFVTTSFFPSIHYTKQGLENGFSESEISAFQWIHNNLPDTSLILASPDEGHLITAISERKNVIDSNYLFIDNINTLFSDVQDIYSTKYETQAIDLLSKHGITHIYLSPRVKSYYKISSLDYTADNDCFKEIYSDKRNDIHIYESSCVLRSL